MYCKFLYKGICQGIVEIPNGSFESQRERFARLIGIKKMDDYIILVEGNTEGIMFSKAFKGTKEFKKGLNRMKYLSRHNNFVK